MKRFKQGFFQKKNKKRENRLWLWIKHLTDILYHKAAVSAVGRSLNDYVGEEKVLEQSFFMRKLKGIFSFIDVKIIKYILQRGFENSSILAWLRNSVCLLLSAMVRQYGVFSFSLGLYTVLVYFLGIYSEMSLNVTYTHLITGSLEILCALPMLISRKSMCEVIRESLFADILLFRFFGLSPELFELEKRESTASPFPLIFGLIAGLATVFVSPVKLLILLIICIMIYITFISPESGLVTIIALMPFLPENILRISVWIVALAYFVKVLRGKRTFKLELTDYAVLTLCVIILLSATVSIAPEISRNYSFLTLTYMGVYFLVVNSVKTRPWVKRFVGAAIFSLVMCVLIGTIQKFVSASGLIFIEDIIIDGRVSAVFSMPIVFAQFIMLFVFYLFAYNISTSSGIIRRFFAFVLSCISVVCLFVTHTPVAFCCFVAALFIFYIFYSKKTLIFTVIFVAVIPFSRYVMPGNVIKYFTEYFAVTKQSLIDRIHVWRISLNMVIERLIGGSGSGTYEYLYSQYALSKGETITESYNTYLQTTVELGLIGLIVFVMVIYLFFKCNLSLFAKQGAGSKNIYSIAGFSGITGILLLANFENLWQDTRFILAFWIAFGLCMAIKRHRMLMQKGYDEYLLKNI
ncbi:MAG: O-antigen ligase family protein [Clostridia bacterium]|nr:O-antigen ligase family protein [Clostridia bacterium]